MKALIVDDEQKARGALQALLAAHCPQVEVAGEAASVPEAIKAVHTQAPELVFLDIEMPGYSGFQLIEMIPDPAFQVIFTTAYSEYALKAFEVSAIDYLLKPIRIQKLVEAVKKAERMRAGHATQQRLSALSANLRHAKLQRLALPTSDGFLFVGVEEIESLEAEGSYTRIYKTDGKQLLVSRLLRDFEKQLQPTGDFMRCHRSHIVNMQQVVKWQKSDGGSLVLRSGRNLPLNKEAREALGMMT